MSLIFGCNSGTYAAMAEAVPGISGSRAYRDTINEIPTVWPGAPGSHSLVSLRPHPDDLLTGALDERIRALLAVATPRAMLTVWHEASNLPAYRDLDFLTPQAVRSMHVRMHDLCHSVPTGVRYGTVTCGTAQAVQDWIPRPAYPMDWYGDDLYQFPALTLPGTDQIATRAVRERLSGFLNLARQRSGLRWPQIVIAETNTPYPHRRPEWFSLVATWLANNGGRRMLSFWKADGPLSGPWLPGDTETIAALADLQARYGSL